MISENNHRARTRLLVSLLPGIHLRELQRLLSVSFSSTRYHVDALSRSREIERVEDGGYSRLYPFGMSQEYKRLFSNARSPTKRRILSTLVQTPGLTNQQLSDVTGLAKSTISQQVQFLTDSGIIRLDLVSETRVTYSLHEPELVSKALALGALGALQKATDRFIDLWDF